MSQTNNPKEFNKTILLTSCGLHPQVITEMIYSVSQQSPPVQFDEIYVITTEVGLKQIKKHLLDKENGFFYQLCREYGLINTSFHEKNIRLLENDMGSALNDVQTLDDNEIVADIITEKVRQLTVDPNSRLYVSLAGGRRTISYYLGYALSLFGRPQDRLSHIIVSHNYEADDEFFYPNKVPTYITDRDGNTLNTQDAKIELAEIPFVRLREGLPNNLLHGKTTFTQAVAAVPKVVKTAQVQIYNATKTIICNDIEIPLTPIQFTWYAWLLSRIKKWGVEEGAIHVRAELHLEFIEYYKKIMGPHDASIEKTEKVLCKGGKGFTVNYIGERNSTINKQIRDSLGVRHDPFAIKSFGGWGKTQYTIYIEPENILFEE